MKRNVAKKVARRKRRILKKLQTARDRRFLRGMDPTPVIGSNAIRYELSERSHAICHGGRLLSTLFRGGSRFAVNSHSPD
ncbi:MAG: hypothetical protein KDB03_28520, partial [Planctomycetales bacterium]|nr:hypothetical protein [Planctomycetales bacterium]